MGTRGCQLISLMALVFRRRHLFCRRRHFDVRFVRLLSCDTQDEEENFVEIAPGVANYVRREDSTLLVACVGSSLELVHLVPWCGAFSAYDTYRAGCHGNVTICLLVASSLSH